MIPKDLNIPGYEIESLLGKGGMASVYRARQQSFGREVALKILNPNVEDAEDFSQRFLQESLIVAKLHHSHIVQVYDVGRYQNYFYICMEYLHGGDLSNKIRAGLTLRESVRIIKQLADALDFAQRKNIIHRDIKPENIMFREDDAAVLMDFGIAKELESKVNLTQTGLVIGTPKYMSPEQIRGEEVDHRADIYALGIVFYRCITNYVPFDGKDMVTTAYLQNNEPVPTLPPEVACFQPILNCMLEKDPDDRFQRGRDVVAALDEIDRNAYAGDLTNLDVAAAAKLAPPTVTRTTSGRHPVKEQPPIPAMDVGPHVPANATQMRASVRLPQNQTVVADHMTPAGLHSGSLKPATGNVAAIKNQEISAERIVPADSLLDSPLDEPVAAPGSRRKSRVVPLLFVLICIGAFAYAADRYSAAIARGAWTEVAAGLRNDLLDRWREATGIDPDEQGDPIASSDENPPAVASGDSPADASGALTPSVPDVQPHTDLAVAELDQDAPEFDEPVSADPPTVQEHSLPESQQGPDGGAAGAVSTDTAVPANSDDVADAAVTDANSESVVTEAAVEEPGVDEVVVEEIEVPAVPDVAEVITQLLDAAEQNMAKKRFRKPADDNAYFNFQKVLELQPDNASALAGIEKIAGVYSAMAKRAIAEQDFDAARGFLADVRAVAPHHANLPEIEVKLAAAIAAQQEAEALAAAAQKADQINELMTAAKLDEEAGRIRAPFGNNALEKYQRILELDPDNSAAIDKLIEYGR